MMAQADADQQSCQQDDPDARRYDHDHLQDCHEEPDDGRDDGKVNLEKGQATCVSTK